MYVSEALMKMMRMLMATAGEKKKYRICEIIKLSDIFLLEEGVGG